MGKIRFVISNEKHNKTLRDICKFFADGNRHWGITVHQCTRISNRGKVEEIYVAGALGSYGVGVGDTTDYITCTNIGYGGYGRLKINAIHNFAYTTDLDTVDNKKKLPLWIMK